MEGFLVAIRPESCSVKLSVVSLWGLRRNIVFAISELFNSLIFLCKLLMLQMLAWLWLLTIFFWFYELKGLSLPPLFKNNFWCNFVVHISIHLSSLFTKNELVGRGHISVTNSCDKACGSLHLCTFCLPWCDGWIVSNRSCISSLKSN